MNEETTAQWIEDIDIVAAMISFTYRSKGFDKTMIAKSILRLEDEGIVYREIDPEDKRIKRLYLTDKGIGLRPDMERIGLELNALLLKGFDSDEMSPAIETVRKIALNAARI